MIRSAVRVFTGAPGRRRSVASLACSGALLAAIAVSLAFTATQPAASPDRPMPGSATAETTPVDYYDGPPISNAQIEREHDRAQACRTFLGYQPWPTSRSWEWAIGSDYRAWLHDLWRRRADACTDVRAFFQPLEHDVPAAARWAAEEWGVDADWMIQCAESEGGTDADRLVHVPGDGWWWWQFLTGTWAWMSNAAWKAVKPAPPPRYKRINSPVGQAYTVGWAFAHGYQTPGAQPIAPQWYGKGC